MSYVHSALSKIPFERISQVASYFASFGHLNLSLFLYLKLGEFAALHYPKHANFMKKGGNVLVTVLEIEGHGGLALEDLMAEFKRICGRDHINK